MTIAGGIAAALYKRATTGVGSVVDVSLMGLAAWNLSPDIAVSRLNDGAPSPMFSHADAPNPLVNNYKTSDDRYITLMMLQLDKFFAEAMTAIGLSEVITDARFSEPLPRYENRSALIALIDEAFAKRTLAEWREALAGVSGAWGVVQTPGELCEDPATVANGYVAKTTTMSGVPFELAVNPVQFDEQHVVPPGAPEHGQHTEEILMDAGLAWDRIQQLKDEGAVL
jgi:crotonobetainyl-CoA:carnitine CoA-transferase CaiB-like acyl-CoA transferase